MRVYRLSKVDVPKRFQPIALLKDESKEHLLTRKHFAFSKEDTDEYNNMSEADKKKVRFWEIID